MYYKNEKEYQKEYKKHLEKGTLHSFCPFIEQTCKGLECKFFSYKNKQYDCLLCKLYQAEEHLLNKIGERLIVFDDDNY